MRLAQLWQRRHGRSSDARPHSPRGQRPRLVVEQLEDRAVPANFTAGNVADLIAAIESSNATVEADTITLAPGATFTMNRGYHNGTRALPAIAAGNDLDIIGSGNVIERGGAGSGSRWFGLFAVAPGAKLTLSNVTLQGGEYARGGAVLNEGTVELTDVTLRRNTAQSGGIGEPARGGAIYSVGTLSMVNCTVSSNQAVGWWQSTPGADGGIAEGGGIYVGGGTASLTNVTISSNTARGGDGNKGGWVTVWGQPTYVPPGDGGDAHGGGLCVVGAAAVTLDHCAVTSNLAAGGRAGGNGAAKGFGFGGGLYVADPPASASVYLDPATVVRSNRADFDPNIHDV